MWKAFLLLGQLLFCNINMFIEFSGGGGGELRTCSVHKYSMFPTFKIEQEGISLHGEVNTAF